MTTLSAMTLRVASLLMEVTKGSAQTGTATTLVDAIQLTKGNQYFDRGTLWMLTGSHAGEVFFVTKHYGNKLTIDSVNPAIAVGDGYAVARAVYPHDQLVSAINLALTDTFIVKEAISAPPADILGDGTTLKFDIPDGFSRVVRVELEHPTDETQVYESAHFRERDGQIIFDSGYPPSTGWKIHIYTRQDHPDLVDYDDQINEQIRESWLKWKAVEHALYWAVGSYGAANDYRIEERLNRAMQELKTLRPRDPLVMMHAG